MDQATKDAITEIDSLIGGHYSTIDMLLQKRISLIPGDASDKELAARILAFIEKEFANENMCVEFIAAEFSLSFPRVSTLINKYLGAGLPTLVNTRRIQKAKLMMSTTDKSIKQIAYACGFEDSHFFSRTFRRLTGMTATEFQEGKAA
jgi:AraC-like DNA-binding protein